MTNEKLLERSIPDRSPGHAFIAMARSLATSICLRTKYAA